MENLTEGACNDQLKHQLQIYQVLGRGLSKTPLKSENNTFSLENNRLSFNKNCDN